MESGKQHSVKPDEARQDAPSTGLRAHVESSILRTMAHALSESGSVSREELRARSDTRSRADHRLLELERGGYVRRAGDTLLLTPRGCAVVRIHRLLTSAWSSSPGLASPPLGREAGS